jgi:hypothetical protein
VEQLATQALEKVLVWIRYTAIVGSAVYFYTELHRLEAAIAMHHGQGWEELKDIVQTSQIQSEVSGAKSELNSKIASSKNDLELILKDKENEIKRLSSRIRSIELWTIQGDTIMTERDKRKYKGHALFTDDGTSDRLCYANYAHPNGKSFKIGDNIAVINADSSKGESTICTVSGTVYDADEPTVLLTLNRATSTTLGFSREKGRIIIFAGLAKLTEKRRWKTLADFNNPPYFSKEVFNNPYAPLPTPAYGQSE